MKPLCDYCSAATPCLRIAAATILTPLCGCNLVLITGTELPVLNRSAVIDGRLRITGYRSGADLLLPADLMVGRGEPLFRKIQTGNNISPNKPSGEMNNYGYT